MLLHQTLTRAEAAVAAIAERVHRAAPRHDDGMRLTGRDLHRRHRLEPRHALRCPHAVLPADAGLAAPVAPPAEDDAGARDGERVRAPGGTTDHTVALERTHPLRALTPSAVERAVPEAAWTHVGSADMSGGLVRLTRAAAWERD